MTRPLYIVSGVHAALLEAATDGVDELEVERALEALDVAGLELADRVGGIVVGLEAIDADVERLRAEEKRLAERRRSLEKRAARIREYVAGCIDASGAGRVRTPTHTVSVASGPETVEVLDQAAVPDACCVFERTPSKSQIMTEYRRTGIVPAGCAINAGRRSLRIK